MPRAGRMDVNQFAAGTTVREIDGYKTEGWTLKGAQTLNIYYEIDNATIEDLIPVAARPSIPAYGIFNVVHFPESPGWPVHDRRGTHRMPCWRASARFHAP